MRNLFFLPAAVVIFTLGFTGVHLLPSASAAEKMPSDDVKEAVVRDWQRQEERLNRTFESPEALSDLAARSRLLLARMQEKELISTSDAASLQKKLDVLAGQNLKKAEPEEIQRLYLALRWKVRDIIFRNPLIQGKPLVFMKGDRYIWQLIHEYLSFYYRYTNTTGRGFYLLKDPGRSFETAALTDGKFPSGSFATPSLSYDAKTLYFAFADFSKIVPEDTPRSTVKELISDYHDHLFEYMKEKEGKYHLFQMDLQSGETRQLTEGPNDDFDPVLLPDGDLVFVSTRRGGFARCTGTYEPVQTATLHKLHKNGKIQCLSWHETSEWNPSVLSDGRIVFSRWDYVDREAARYMNLWIMNPDGTGTQALFGNYTEKVVASLQPEEIPDSNKILFVGSGHHLAVGGPLVILDPTKVRYNTKTGEDTLDCLDVLTPDIPFPETPVEGNPEKHHVSDHYYYSPYPLSEDFYLTSFSHDPNGGYLAIHGYSGYTGSCGTPFTAGKLGLYYRDRFGNLELIYEDPETSCRYPLQLAEHPVPRIIPSTLPEEEPESTPEKITENVSGNASEVNSETETEVKTETELAGASMETGLEAGFGTFVLTNVYESLIPLPEERPIKELRIFQIFPKFPDFVADKPKVSHAFAANTRAYLGSVPVEADGSAHFRVPARTPLYFQAVDAEGKAVRTMLSEVYLQPGENRGCIGCHEQAQTTQKNLAAGSRALHRSPSELVPGPAGTQPFSYPILIQPILDRACISCHDGKKDSPRPSLSGEEDENGFTVSYNNLHPFLKWYGWSTTIHRITSVPEMCGCDISELTEILDDEHHEGKIRLSGEDRRTLYLWMDANSPFYGSDTPEEMERQLRGEEITRKIH